MKRFLMSLAAVLALGISAAPVMAQTDYTTPQSTTADPQQTSATDQTTTEATITEEPLPATASPMGMVAVASLAALAAGLALSRRRRRA